MAVDTAVGLPVELDLLAGASWSCVSAPAGTVADPDALDDTNRYWMGAAVPGTVAGALRDVGASEPSLERLDGHDWWYRCRFDGPVPGAPITGGGEGWILTLEGLATLADVWLNGHHLLRAESMFDAWRVPVAEVAADNELCIRFAAFTPELAVRRPRPRWKTKGVVSQQLRWFRTSLLGRQAGWAAVPVPVGPWRPVTLRPVGPVEVLTSRVRTSCRPGLADTTAGTVSVDVEVRGGAVLTDGSVPVELVVGGRSGPLEARPTDGGVRLIGSLTLDDVERWWPHTHGTQALYAARIVVGGVRLDLGQVGFRTIDVDRTDGAFRVSVNGVPVFCRGSCWYPLDPVTLQSTEDAVNAAVDQARAAGMNMLRIPGDTVYEDDRFFVACDRAGIMVWQDAMLGPVDPPADDAFTATVVAEVTDLLERTARHPSLAVLCGGQQIEEQAAIFGLPRDRWRTPLLETVLPGVVAREAPELAYVQASPTGGELPFQADAGICHYVGVGVHLFPVEDFRRASPRFVSEGLAFAIPPEQATVDEEFGGGISAHHESDWKRGVHRDAGSWFDLEDVRDHYTTSFFAVDMSMLWRTDHERALDLGRATMAEIMQLALSEWRRASSRCDGLLTVALRDLRPGPGWGLVDSTGRPKAPWYTFARCAAPVAVLLTDEGVNGLDVHVVNDTADAVDATLELGLHTAVHTVERVSCPVLVPARGGLAVRAEGLFDGFRDLTFAFCFGARTYDLVTAELVDAAGSVLTRAGYLPGGTSRDVDPDVGLQAGLEPVDGGAWLLTLSSRRFAEYVQVDVPGYIPDDSWFHLPPHGERKVRLHPEPGVGRAPQGRVRALNSATVAVVTP